jgi:hypothetical protein
VSGGQARWSELQAGRFGEAEEAAEEAAEGALDSRDVRYKARMAALRQVMQ